MHKPLHLLDRKRLLSNSCGLILSLLILSTPALSDVTGDLSNNYVDSNVDSNNTTNNYNAAGAASAAPVMSAIAPTVMGGGGNDSCLMPTSTGISLSMFGFSSGGVVQDDACNRRKNARLLGAPQTVGGLGLQVSAISVLCQDPMVFRSMMLANTPCPITDTSTGKLLMGKAAIQKYRENPEVFIVGYKLDTGFWDAILAEKEESDEVVVSEDTGPSLSISDMFRSSKRRGLHSDGTGEDSGTD